MSIKVLFYMVQITVAATRYQHGLQVAEGFWQRFSTEEDPGDHDCKQGVQVANGSRQPVQDLSETNSFDNQESTVQQTSDDKIPAGTVPEAAQEEDDNQVAVSSE